MSLRQLRILTIVLPPLLLAALVVTWRWLANEPMRITRLDAIVLLIALAGMIGFAWIVGSRFDRLQRQLVGQHQELLALHTASQAISRDLQLPTVLQQVVNEASQIIGVRFGALSFSRHFPELEAFVTYGIPDHLREVIGEEPHGKGVLGVTFNSGESLRTNDVTADPRYLGFPPHHPDIRTLLVVPIIGADSTVGNLYLGEKTSGEAFTSDDERTLRRFASLAAIAIDNAILHSQVEATATTGERDRLSREMHDSLAQVLAYAITKTQAATTLLDRGDTRSARAQVEQLESAAREAYIDVREGIHALRHTTPQPGDSVIETIANYAERWQEHHGIQVEIASPDTRPRIDTLAELHLLRLTQEALTNIRKHANATQVHISFALPERVLNVTIEDNGEGFSPDQPVRGENPQFGLSTMRERAEAVGGTFVIESEPGSGTRIHVTVPRIS